MDNILKPDVWKISRRFLFYYFPIFICYLLLSITMKLAGHDIGFPLFSFFQNMFIIFIMYLFIIVPVILFKPKKSSSRRMVMLLFTFLFTALLLYISIKSYSSSHTMDTASLLKAIFESGYSISSSGILICLLYYVEEMRFIAIDRIASERNIKLKNERMITETHLKLLQAQIEPHFLFNTLTSILSFSTKDPNKAKIMHNNFKQYLKTTLSKTRSSVTTIGQDIELIKAYLDIFKVRMGERLQYSIEAGDEVIDLPFPSMLIQPIVENAIKHGLEPKIEGGEISIKVIKTIKDTLCWNIEDTGLGMPDNADMGTGLTNIMERVEALYGDEGHFTLEDNKPSGVKVTLEVPYA